MNTENRKNKTMLIAAATLSVATVAAVHAQSKDQQYTYRCTGKDGKKYYGQTVPQACIGGPMELINKQGSSSSASIPRPKRRRASRGSRCGEEARARDGAKESMRRNQALLATYTSERDIEEARTRALRDHQKQLSEVERRIEELQKRQARVEKELAVYNESGKGEPPTRLKEEITNADIDLRAQQGLLEVKKKEASSINARYDEDKRRYLELTGKKKERGVPSLAVSRVSPAVARSPGPDSPFPALLSSPARRAS